MFYSLFPGRGQLSKTAMTKWGYFHENYLRFSFDQYLEKKKIRTPKEPFGIHFQFLAFNDLLPLKIC